MGIKGRGWPREVSQVMVGSAESRVQSCMCRPDAFHSLGVVEVAACSLVLCQLRIVNIRSDRGYWVMGQAVCHHDGDPAVVVDSIQILSQDGEVPLLTWGS